jgi:Holliday junction DNA helicase RuvB
MRIGFLERTIRGRKLTARAYEHLGFAHPQPGHPPHQKKLFKD